MIITAVMTTISSSDILKLLLYITPLKVFLYITKITSPIAMAINRVIMASNGEIAPT